MRAQDWTCNTDIRLRAYRVGLVVQEDAASNPTTQPIGARQMHTCAWSISITDVTES